MGYEMEKYDTTPTLFAIHNEKTEKLMKKIEDCGIECQYGGPPDSGEEPILCDNSDVVYIGWDEINKRIESLKT